MLSFQIDNELTKQLIALNEAISEKNVLLGAISSQDREAIHHYAWISQCSDGKFAIDPKDYKIEYFLRYMIKVLQGSLNDIDFYIKRVDSFKKLFISKLEKWW